MLKRPRPELAITFLGCFLVVVFVAAQPKSITRPSPSAVSQTAQQIPLPAESPSANEQILRAQLENAHYYDQQILSTVYWSLGGVFLIVIVVGGINWISNYRLYEREREILKQEMATSFKSEFYSLEERFKMEFAELAKRIELKLTEIDDVLKK